MKDRRHIIPVSPPFLDFIIICFKIRALRDKRGFNAHYSAHYFAHYFGLMMIKKGLRFPKDYGNGKGIRTDSKGRFYFRVGVPPELRDLYPTKQGGTKKQFDKYLTGLNGTYQDALRNLPDVKRDVEQDLADRLAKHDPIVRKAEILLEKICEAFDENDAQLSRQEWNFDKINIDINDLGKLKARETDEELAEYNRLINNLRQVYLNIANYKPPKMPSLDLGDEGRELVEEDGQLEPSRIDLDFVAENEEQRLYEEGKPFYHDVGMVGYTLDVIRRYRNNDPKMKSWDDAKVLNYLKNFGTFGELGYTAFNKKRYDEILKAYKELEDENYNKTTGKGNINVSFSEASEMYNNALKPNVGRIKTLNKYKLGQRKFMEWGGDLDLTQFNAQLCEDYVTHMEQNEQRPYKTIRDRVTAVNQVLNHAKRQGLIEQNQWLGVELRGRGKKSKPRALWLDRQLKELVKLDMPNHFLMLFKVLICTGMRLEEACLLEWRDIQHNEEQIPLIDLFRVNNVLKNEQSRRRVPIAKVLKMELDRFAQTLTDKELEPESKLFARCNFTLDADNKMSTSSSKKLIRIYESLQSPDYDRLTNHGLRKTFRNKCRDKGLQDSEARYLGGWEQSGVDTSYLGQPQSFQRLYTFLNDMGFNFIMER